jgi:hypothetical protein
MNDLRTLIVAQGKLSSNRELSVSLERVLDALENKEKSISRKFMYAAGDVVFTASFLRIMSSSDDPCILYLMLEIIIFSLDMCLPGNSMLLPFCLSQCILHRPQDLVDKTRIAHGFVRVI